MLLDGNPILWPKAREMGLPSNDMLKMYRQPDSSTTFAAASARLQPKQLCLVINRLREMKTARHLNVPEKGAHHLVVRISVLSGRL